MAQRVALARALVNEPKLFLLDEPFAKLDALTRMVMQGEFVALWRQSAFTSILVTHDVEESLLLAQRIIVLSDRPATKRAEVINNLPYPRHRDDRQLQLLRREIFGHLGMATSL
jgi:NitT/TauT family transport system ATP-binding protein